VPGWHEATKEWQEAGDVRMVGIIEEQHPERARLFMQWKKMGWPILVDSLNLLETTVVPQTLLIDEHGIIREVRPALDELDRVRREFVDVDFEPPAVGLEARRIEPSPAEHAYLRANELDAVLAAFEQEAAANPAGGYTLFRAGVAYRARHDSPGRRAGDFQTAVTYWERALQLDPNNYIWRRRIQQYGPRLDKPYPFYDWVREARAEIIARGETPVPLVIEPIGAELASPSKEFVGAAAPHAPEIDERILRDDGVFVTAETTLVPSAVAAGESARAHVRFVPNDAIKGHWNNEVDGLVFRVEPPAGWQVDHPVQTLPNPPEAVSREPRSVELELRASEGAGPGVVQIPAYALYYVCEDVNGVCMYRRQDVTLRLRVEG